MKIKARPRWMLAAVALHLVPIALIWSLWQQSRLEAAASAGGRALQVHLLPQFAALPPSSAVGKSSNSMLPVGAVHAVSEISEPSFPVAEQSEPIFPDVPVYLNSNELDIRPQPITPLTIPFPDAALPEGMVSALLVIYIGLDGKVDKVEVMESSLPPLFEEVAIKSFMNATMQAGEKEGKTVRSFMKVVVEFESRPAY